MLGYMTMDSTEVSPICSIPSCELNVNSLSTMTLLKIHVINEQHKVLCTLYGYMTNIHESLSFESSETSE